MFTCRNDLEKYLYFFLFIISFTLNTTSSYSNDDGIHFRLGNPTSSEFIDSLEKNTFKSRNRPTYSFFEKDIFKVDSLNNIKSRNIFHNFLKKSVVPTSNDDKSFAFGEEANSTYIKNLDIAISSKGIELPNGQGNAQLGKKIYEEKCLHCHGVEGDPSSLNKSVGKGWYSESIRILPPALAGGLGTLNTQLPKITVGSYWPHATTIFDYIRRAMPPEATQSLSNEEVYSLTAYILFVNNIISNNKEINSDNLHLVDMPNKGGFINAWGSEWYRNWINNLYSVIIATILLSFIFFNFLFASKLIKHLHYVRKTILLLSLIYLGWILEMQVGFYHIKNLVDSYLSNDNNLTSFLTKPTLFIILTFTIITSLIFGRGLFCGWVCPFGALQDIIFFFSKTLRKKINFVIKTEHDKLLKKLKYLILMTLVFSIFFNFKTDIITRVEPFEALILNPFQNSISYLIWPSVIIFLSIFIQRGFCRYICPTGAGLALLGSLSTLNWLKRRNACGTLCNKCETVCPTNAIEKNGSINNNECILCFSCQTVYNDDLFCPHTKSISILKK